MAIIAKENFERAIRECLSRFCDKEISDTTENVDPEGYNKVRTVIWHYKPYTFKAAYIFGGDKEYPNFAPLGIMARLDGSSEEEKLRTGNDLVEKIQKANLMREAGMV